MPKHRKENEQEGILPMEIENLLLRRKLLALDLLDIQHKLDMYANFISADKAKSALLDDSNLTIDPDIVYEQARAAFEEAEKLRQQRNLSLSIKDKITSFDLSTLL